jgi:hypothetical protein
VWWWWAAVAVLALVLGVAMRRAHAQRRLYRATTLLYGGDPAAFLRLVEAEARWQGRVVLALNRGVGRFWQGRFEESLALARSVGGERMAASTRAAHDSCVLAALVLLGRADEAERLFTEREASMRASGHPLTEMMCKSIEADIAFYGHGDLDRTERLCRELLALPGLPDIAIASIHWSLGEVAARRGDSGAAEEHLAAALPLAGDTFVAERAAALRARLRGRDDRSAGVSQGDDEPPDSLDPVVRPPGG